MTDINATQLTGLLAFGCAALFSVRASVTDVRERIGWMLIASGNAMFVLEIWFGARHSLHDVLVRWLKVRGVYDARHMTQDYLIAAVLVMSVAGLAVAMRALWHKPVGLRYAWLSFIVTIILFAVEIVSLHVVDGILYCPVGFLALIGWLWLGLGGVTSLAASGRPSPQESIPS